MPEMVHSNPIAHVESTLEPDSIARLDHTFFIVLNGHIVRDLNKFIDYRGGKPAVSD
jgi:hypothetical protein